MTLVKNKWSIREKYKPALQEIKNQQRIKHGKNNDDHRVIRHKMGIVKIQTKKLRQIVQK